MEFGLRRLGHEDVHAQSVKVLHEYMSAIAELRRLAVALSHEREYRSVVL